MTSKLLTMLILFSVIISCQEKKKEVKEKANPIVEIQEKIANVIKNTKPSIITVISQFKDNFILRDENNESLGSGFIVKKDKDFIYILTDAHVIEKSNNIKVRFFNGVESRAYIVGKDDKSDVAVLKVKNSDRLKDVYPVKVGNLNKVKAGYFVLSAGSPYNLNYTYTFGIISSLHRNLGLSPYEDYIQTDAAINPGNSGGPLFNINGEVIGMNVAVIDTGEGIGFALPINTVLDIYKDIIKYGKVPRGWLGVLVQPLSEKALKTLKIKNGVVIIKVFKNSPAEKAGLKVGDIIVSINEKNVKSPQDLSFEIQKLKPNQKVTLKILRKNKLKQVQVFIEPSDMLK